MSAESTRFIHVIYIASTPQKVFEAITRPEIASRYWGHENVSDWKPGSRWQHVRANETRSVELVGEVVESTRPRAWSSPGPPPRRPTTRMLTAASPSTSCPTRTWCG